MVFSEKAQPSFSYYAPVAVCSLSQLTTFTLAPSRCFGTLFKFSAKQQYFSSISYQFCAYYFLNVLVL